MCLSRTLLPLPLAPDDHAFAALDLQVDAVEHDQMDKSLLTFLNSTRGWPKSDVKREDLKLEVQLPKMLFTP